MNPATWTPERVETLKTKWAAGWSAGQIRAELPGFSRNAILGKIDRLKLTRDRGVVRKPRKPRAVGRQPGAVRNTTRIQAKVNGHDPGLSARFEAPSDGAGIQLFDLTNETCRWPKGTPGHADFCFCGRLGADLIAARPYCAEHTAAARR